ncbi:MAG: ComF family protein [Sedimenticola sp.]|nr:ComF family protein [Sedimenticola sp.]
MAHQRHSIECPELLIPVPLHPNRIKHRGFNQALELASVIGRELAIPVDHKHCRRLCDNTPQAGLNKLQRRSNIRGAFEIKNGLNVSHIALVDDVVTTGSTVNELARQLKKTGIQRIDVWAIARTP